jgi:iron complex outermembrane recepter protein
VLGASSSEGSRTVSAVYAELAIPLFKNLEASLAGRYDKYSDFGSTTNPKVALRWTPTKELLFRTSYSTGFRAPTLSDLFLPRFLSNTADNHNDPLRCANSTPRGGYVNEGLECDAQFQNQLGGNTALQPEKSKNWTIGMIFEPTPATSVGIDFWKIERRNTIGALGDNTVFDVFAAADPLTAGGRFVRNIRNANGTCVGDLPGNPTPANVPCSINFVVQVQENLGKYNTNGFDISGTAKVGPVTLRMEGTYILQYRYQQQTDAEYLDNVGRVTSDNGSIPRWRHYASVNWQGGPFGATLSQNFVLGYVDDTPNRRVATYSTWDMQGRWDAWKGLGLTLGVKNIFDRDPPASNQGQTFQVGYDPRYTDAHGRTYYMGLKYAFK